MKRQARTKERANTQRSHQLLERVLRQLDLWSRANAEIYLSISCMPFLLSFCRGRIARCIGEKLLFESRDKECGFDIFSRACDHLSIESENGFTFLMMKMDTDSPDGIQVVLTDKVSIDQSRPLKHIRLPIKRIQ